jgi:hypothetical protein
MDWPTVGILTGLVINGIIGGVGWGRNTQKLSDLSDHVSKQNGRLNTLEGKEVDCKLDVEHRLTALEAIDKLEKK